jgi:cytochrome c-type biogenesis protein CcmH/NrfF
VQENTYLLWLAPMLLLLGGAFIMRTIIKKRTVLLETTPNDEPGD